MRIILFLLLALPACSSKPVATKKPPAPTGYAYTERTYPDSKRNVQTAGTALLQELWRSSTPSVPGEISEENDEASTGWLYSTESGQPVRRRYHLSYIPADAGTLVVASIQEERKESDSDTWQSSVPNNATYHAFFIRLQSKIRKIR